MTPKTEYAERLAELKQQREDNERAGYGAILFWLLDASLNHNYTDAEVLGGARCAAADLCFRARQIADAIHDLEREVVEEQFGAECANACRTVVGLPARTGGGL